MAYVFKPNQSIAHNINRILGEEVTAALDALKSPDQINPETIHTIRKRIKKIRALFRLVRSGLKEKDFQHKNSQFRTIGHRLGPLRDATVMIKTLTKLGQAQPAGVPTRVLATLHKALLQQQDQAASAFFQEGNQINEVARAFAKASRKATGLSKKHTGFGVMAPNLKSIYRRARKALKVAIDDPGIDQLHELRKDVKTLWYHTRLLLPIWPGLFKAYEQEFGRLGELLGDDHDFGVVAQAIEADQLLVRNKPTKEALLRGLQAQRDQLQAQIFPLAHRLLAEKPGVFVNRLNLHWRLWQQEATKQLIDHPQAT
jgi:CHAD domain-containing protein